MKRFFVGLMLVTHMVHASSDTSSISQTNTKVLGENPAMFMGNIMQTQNDYLVNNLGGRSVNFLDCHG